MPHIPSPLFSSQNIDFVIFTQLLAILAKMPPSIDPSKNPWNVSEEDKKMKQWLTEIYSALSFNHCLHQSIPIMIGRDWIELSGITNYESIFYMFWIKNKFSPTFSRTMSNPYVSKYNPYVLEINKATMKQQPESDLLRLLSSLFKEIGLRVTTHVI